jgi:hypothetical protein
MVFSRGRQIVVKGEAKTPDFLVRPLHEVPGVRHCFENRIADGVFFYVDRMCVGVRFERFFHRAHLFDGRFVARIYAGGDRPRYRTPKGRNLILLGD